DAGPIDVLAAAGARLRTGRHVVLSRGAVGQLAARVNRFGEVRRADVRPDAVVLDFQPVGVVVFVFVRTTRVLVEFDVSKSRVADVAGGGVDLFDEGATAGGGGADHRAEGVGRTAGLTRTGPGRVRSAGHRIFGDLQVRPALGAFNARQGAVVDQAQVVLEL